jgi:NADH-quinone oxidoreductase E subunit
MEETKQNTFKITPDLRKRMDAILPNYVRKRAALLPVLNLLHNQFGYITPEIEIAVAEYLELPVMQVREVVSFYTLFQTQPQGKNLLRVCRTLSCYLSGQEEILDYLKGRLGIEVGKTTPDQKCSLATVECLGACELAPMMQFNEKYVGPLNKEVIDQILDQIQK